MTQAINQLPDDRRYTGRSHAAVALREVIRFFSLARRHKQIIIVSILMGGILGGLKIAAERSKPTSYQANASLLLQRVDSEPHSGVFFGSGAPTENYRRMLLSDAVMEGAIAQLHELPPEIDPALPSESWPRELRELLGVKATNNSSVMEVSFESSDPHAPSQVIHAVIHAADAFLDSNQQNMSLELVKALDEERTDLEQRLFQKERELLGMQQRVGALRMNSATEAVHPVIKRAIELNQAFLESQRRSAELQAALITVRKTVREGGDLMPHLKPLENLLGRQYLENFLEVRDAKTLAEMKQRLFEEEKKLAAVRRFYGAAHPKVVKARDAVQKGRARIRDVRWNSQQSSDDSGSSSMGRRLLRMLEESVAAERERQATLRGIYESAEEKAIRLNGQLAKVAIAERDVTLLREMHRAILNRLARIDVNPEHPSMQLIVLNQPASTGIPIPKMGPAKILVFFLMVGFSCGLVAVYALDLLDDRFRTPEDLTEQIRAPLLSVIQDLPGNDAKGVDALHVRESGTEARSEAFRTLRTALSLSNEPRERLAVVSAEPQDGKTTVLANLGATYAQAGKRTLLIDADMRNPGLTRLFDMRTHDGLSNVLRAETDVAAACNGCIRESGLPELHVLPCGPKPSNPSELLSGTRLADVVAWAETVYDQVLIDAPPIAAATDSALVARHANGVVLVVQPKKNRRQLVLRAADVLRGLGVDIVGVVANRMVADQDDAYGYGSAYGYGYGEADHDQHDQRDQDAQDEYHHNDDLGDNPVDNGPVEEGHDEQTLAEHGHLNGEPMEPSIIPISRAA